MTRKSILFIGFGLLLTAACSHNPLDVNPEGIAVNIKFVNLDSVLVHTSQKDLKAQVEKTGIKEEQILAYELGQCLGVGPLSDSGTVSRIKLFVNDRFVSRVEKRIQEKFNDLSVQKANITEGFRFLKFHFPEGKMPANIIFINSHLT